MGGGSSLICGNNCRVGTEMMQFQRSRKKRQNRLVEIEIKSANVYPPEYPHNHAKNLFIVCLISSSKKDISVFSLNLIVCYQQFSLNLTIFPRLDRNVKIQKKCS
jgi:hypothetical protein